MKIITVVLLFLVSIAKAQLYFFSSYYFQINNPPRVENAERLIVSFSENGLFNVKAINMFHMDFLASYKKMVQYHKIKKLESSIYVSDCIDKFKLRVQLYYACPVARVSYRARGSDFDANRISVIYKKYKSYLHQKNKSWKDDGIRDQFNREVGEIYPWMKQLALSFGLSIYNLQRCRSQDGTENQLMTSAGLLTEDSSRKSIASEFHFCYKQVFGYY